ncbi:MAG: hypothetical protein JW873_00580 [Candidatus Saganbacteria bacterium]|nr:hypothetical protein [Candidatus Saganbacteria bacterium]
MSGYVLVITFVSLILPMFGYTQFGFLDSPGSLIFIGFTTYAITKHRLMDMSVVISRSVAEFLAVFFHAVIYLSLVIAYRAYVSTRIELAFLLLTMLYGIFVGQTHHRLRLFFQTTADKLFLRGEYNYYKALSDASSRVGSKLSLPDILKVLYDTFYDVIEVAEPRVFLPEFFTVADRTSADYVVYDPVTYQPQAESQRVKSGSVLTEVLVQQREPLTDVKALKAALVIPCLLEDRLIAFFALGLKLAETAYTEEDRRLLKVLANQVAITLDHSRSYGKIKADLEAAERQLERSQRLASLGTLTAGVTHEIRNPLTVIRAETERLGKQPRDAEYLKRYSELMLKHVDRIAGIVQRMLGLAKEKKRREADVDLNEVIRASLGCFFVSNVKVSADLGRIPALKGDPDELQEVFVNLIQNAFDSMPGGGELKLRSYQDDGHIMIEVSDTGKGVAEENREKIFDPFYSTRHEGVGLGLSIAYRIVREHGGDIKVESAVGHGATFKLIFTPTPT